jgi:aminoglycoside phosphotransferase (APT) family kinase protein
VDDDVDGLRQWLRRNYGPHADLVECDKGSAGFSNETWSLTVHDGGVVRNLILRKPRTEMAFFPDYDLDFQYAILKALAATPIPAPVPLEFEHDAGCIGTPFYLMERIAPGTGIVPIDGPPSGIHGMGIFFDSTEERRTALWHSAIDAIAEVHAVDVNTVDLPFAQRPRDLRDVVEAQLEVIDEWHRHGSSNPIPALVKASAVLRDTVPEQDDIVLCWGDPKPGNLVFVDDAVAGVLDWEMAHLGTPEMDVMYWIVTDEVSASSYGLPRLPGCPTGEETVQYYEQRSGRQLRNLDFHRMFQTLRLATLLVLADRVVTQMGIAEYFPDNWATNNEPYRKLESLL